MTLIYWIAAAIIILEALNKLERTCPLRRGLITRQRIAEVLKMAAWGVLAAGGFSAFWQAKPPTLPETCLALGFAILIIRTRVKEG